MVIMASCHLQSSKSQKKTSVGVGGHHNTHPHTPCTVMLKLVITCHKSSVLCFESPVQMQQIIFLHPPPKPPTLASKAWPKVSKQPNEPTSSSKRHHVSLLCSVTKRHLYPSCRSVPPHNQQHAGRIAVAAQYVDATLCSLGGARRLQSHNRHSSRVQPIAQHHRISGDAKLLEVS
jgi:hypothetical protein